MGVVSWSERAESLVSTTFSFCFLPLVKLTFFAAFLILARNEVSISNRDILERNFFGVPVSSSFFGASFSSSDFFTSDFGLSSLIVVKALRSWLIRDKRRLLTLSDLDSGLGSRSIGTLTVPNSGDNIFGILVILAKSLPLAPRLCDATRNGAARPEGSSRVGASKDEFRLRSGLVVRPDRGRLSVSSSQCLFAPEEIGSLERAELNICERDPLCINDVWELNTDGREPCIEFLESGMEIREP